MAGERVRASDAEREQYAKMLRAAMTEGRLTLEEGEERLGQVYAARFRDELPAVTADLPDGGRRGLYETPEAQRDWSRRGRRYLAGHTGLVVVVAAVLTGLWALSGAHFFWPAIPLFFLVIGLAKHARWRRWAARQGSFGPWGHHHHHRWGQGPWAAHSDEGWRR